MELNFESDVPIYAQIAEQIESSILAGTFAEETQIPSTTEISVSYKINPATVLKGVNLLASENLLYKRRGIGMFVAKDAKEKIRDKRRQTFFQRYVVSLLAESERLGISKPQLLAMIDGGINRE